MTIMKIGGEPGRVVEQKKDVESAQDNSRKSGRSMCEFFVNTLLFTVALIFIGLGAYAWKQIVFKEPQSVMIMSLYSRNITNVYLGLPKGQPIPARAVPAPFPHPVVDPIILLTWPEIFQREGKLTVYDGPLEEGWRCWFHKGFYVTQDCLRRCYGVLGSTDKVWNDSEGGCNGWTDASILKDIHSAPMSHQLKNFTMWPEAKLFATKTLKPTVTIKMPLLNMSFSDHAKMCLSFCALHPECHACSAFPEEPMQVDRVRDRAVGPVGFQGTLSCLLFVGTGTRENPVEIEILSSYGTVSYIFTQGNLIGRP